MVAHRMSLGHMAAVGASIAAHAAVALTVALHQPVSTVAPDPESIVTVDLVDAADLFPAMAPAPAPARPEEPPAPSPAPSPKKSAAAVTAQAPSPPATTMTLAEAPRTPPPVSVPLPPTPRPAVAPSPAAEDPLIEYRRRVWAHLAARAPSAPRGVGVAVVVFGLDESGAVQFVRLGRSSGHPGFDRACLQAIRAAAPLPSAPAGVSRDSLVFEVPIKPRTAGA